MREDREGIVGFRLTYDVDGVPRNCEIISTSGYADLDGTTCRLLMERARFQPGKNPAGKPVGGTYSNRIRWMIPRDIYVPATVAESFPSGPVARGGLWSLDLDARYPKAAREAGEEGEVGFRIGVNPAGRVSGCTITRSSGSAALDAATCTVLAREGRFTAARDIDGNPVAGRVEHSFTWRLPVPASLAGNGGLDENLAGRPAPDPIGPGSMILEYVIDADGAVADCKTHVDGFFAKGLMAAEMRDGCAPVLRRAPYDPPRDAAGQPVSRRYRTSVNVGSEDIPAISEAQK